MYIFSYYNYKYSGHVLNEFVNSTCACLSLNIHSSKSNRKILWIKLFVLTSKWNLSKLSYNQNSV